jgi:hypothetical protein
MKPWKIIARATNPGGDDLVLWQRDAEFVVRVGNTELMSSRRHGSEEAMATAALSAPWDSDIPYAPRSIASVRGGTSWLPRSRTTSSSGTDVFWEALAASPWTTFAPP